MKQILQSYKTGELWLAEVPVPACRSGGMVIKTKYSFVSAGTERMLVDFARKNILGKAVAMPDQVKKVLQRIKSEGILNTVEKVRAKLDKPIPLGYSCAGVVEEVGKGVPGFSVGDRVACGGAGYANHSDYNYVPKNLVVKIPDSVSFEDASCATVGSVALQGVRQCDLRLGENVCVMGLGLLGLLAVQMFKASGVRVIGYDPDKDRCKLALGLGADKVVSSDLSAAVSCFSDGFGMDAVLIAAASKSSQPVAVAGEISRIKGNVVVTGLVGMDIPREMYYKKELDFKLSLSYGPGRYDSFYEEGGHDYPYAYVRWTEQRNIKAFLEMVASGSVMPSKLVTHRFGIEDALNAYSIMLGKTAEPCLGITVDYTRVNENESGNQNSRKKFVSSNDLRVTKLCCDNIKPAKGFSPSMSIGMIGAGNFTGGVLLPALRKQPSLRLRGICAATGMNAAEMGKKHGFEFATTDYRQLLEDPHINTVFVTTPHDSHAHFVRCALKAGKHVFVEKPLCINSDDLYGISEIFSRLENKNISFAGCNTMPQLMVGFNRRFSPHARLLKNYFQGRNTPMMINYRVNAGIVPKDVWIQDPHVGGGRIIGEVCHFIDFTSFLTGSDPVEVQAMCLDSVDASLVAEDNVSISVKYMDGSVAQVLYVAVGARELAKEYCEVFADQSSAVMDNYCSTVCMGRLGKKKLKGKQAKGFSEEINAFKSAVEKNGPAPVSFNSLVATTACTFAVLESLRTGKKVPVPDRFNIPG